MTQKLTMVTIRGKKIRSRRHLMENIDVSYTPNLLRPYLIMKHPIVSLQIGALK